VTPGWTFEAELWEAGHRVVAGVDEAGRGAWAGPVVVGVVLLPVTSHPFVDSKSVGPARRAVLAAAVRALPEEDRPDHVVFAGDGPTMPLVRSLVDGDPWLQARCRFLGMIEDTAEFLAAIDYLVLSSETEGLPNVVLEAMAMSRPVVSTGVSDIPRVIEGAGVVAERGDVATFAAALRAMQRRTPAERRELGEHGRRRVERDYDIVEVAERFWRAHAALLPGVQGPAPRRAAKG